MVLPIAQLGQPVLRSVAKDVDPTSMASPAFRGLLVHMFQTLQQAGGVGLAAPQVFAGYRVFLAVISQAEAERLTVEVFINPKIVRRSEQRQSDWEGCLSFPELQVLVSRACAVTVEYLNAGGDRQSLHLEGLPARVVQHELDHLDGILTIDRAETTNDIVKASELEVVKQHRATPTPAPPDSLADF
ncbi:MAG: peptide deformylase [Gemmataceae bacterium]|nr:peptide deformylase [Gemmataceae bacterium]